MKINTLTILMLVQLVVFLTACKDKNENNPSNPAAEAKKNLVRTWKVNMEGTSKNLGTSTDYEKFTLTFLDNETYTMSNYEKIEPINRPNQSSTGSGNWKISDDAKQITFDGNKTIKISTLTSTNFIFNFKGKASPKFEQDINVEYNMLPN